MCILALTMPRICPSAITLLFLLQLVPKRHASHAYARLSPACEGECLGEWSGSWPSVQRRVSGRQRGVSGRCIAGLWACPLLFLLFRVSSRGASSAWRVSAVLRSKCVCSQAFCVCALHHVSYVMCVLPGAWPVPSLSVSGVCTCLCLCACSPVSPSLAVSGVCSCLCLCVCSLVSPLSSVSGVCSCLCLCVCA